MKSVKCNSNLIVPYSRAALRNDRLRLQCAWTEYRAGRRNRNAVYGYLTEVFELLQWWHAEGKAIDRAAYAASLQDLVLDFDPFSELIMATTPPGAVDKKTRCKWSAALRLALAVKAPGEPLRRFMRRHGGINECATCYRRLRSQIESH
jgi:hypothetical protein